MASESTSQIAWHPVMKHHDLGTATDDLLECVKALSNTGQLLRLPMASRDRILASTDAKAIVQQQIRTQIEQIAANPTLRGIKSVVQDIDFVAAQPDGAEDSFDLLRDLAYEAQRTLWDRAYAEYCDEVWILQHTTKNRDGGTQRPPHFSNIDPKDWWLFQIDSALRTGISNHIDALKQAKLVWDYKPLLNGIMDDIAELNSVNTDQDEFYGKGFPYGHGGPDHGRFYLRISTFFLQMLHSYETAGVLAEKAIAMGLPPELTEMVRDYVCGEEVLEAIRDG